MRLVTAQENLMKWLWLEWHIHSLGLQGLGAEVGQYFM